MAKTRVLLADDHRLMLVALRRVLALDDSLEVVGEVMVGSKVLPAVGETRPDVVLLDIRMPELDGLSCLRRLRERYPATRVVMLSTYGDDEHVAAAREGGASGYVVKTIEPRSLPELIRTVLARPDDFLVAGGVVTVPEREGEPALSGRERAVLEAVARGLSNAQIAAELWVSEQTVKFHLRNLYRKLGVASRTEAAHYALSHGRVNALVGSGTAAAG